MRSAVSCFLAFLATIPAWADESVNFNRDVRPILAEHCWQCHGFDQHSRKAGLRLDLRSDALLAAESGTVAIVPHDPDHSELIKRISTADDTLQMPPAKLGKPLSAAQIETLRKWITEGAHYQRHWAFETLSKPFVPAIDDAANPIDAFIAVELARSGLTFAPEASREALLRRVSLDLTGLPPSLEVLDDAETPYEATVDRLLSSQHFGERMAVDWLDLARYADTNGYFSDKPRLMWLWRDWVINAFNCNMPFDQFTIEQLAGDLLPDATVSQRIATGFNRNHVANNETGIIDEEFRIEYVVDRIDTTMTTWMGLTAGCAQCHDHKYDPISQQEFYQLFAFFNNVPETGLIVSDNPPPLMTVSTPEQDQQLTTLTAQAAKDAAAFELFRPRLVSEIAAWESTSPETLPCPPEGSLIYHEPFNGQLTAGTLHVGTPLNFHAGVRGDAARFDATQHAERSLTEFDADSPWTIGFWISPDGSLSCPLSKIHPEGDRKGIEFLWQKGRLTVNLVEQWGVSAIEVSTQGMKNNGQWHHVAVRYNGSKTANGLRVFIDGSVSDLVIHRDLLTGAISNDLPLLIGRRDSGLGHYGVIDELRILQRSVDDQEVAQWCRSERIRGILETPVAARSGSNVELLLDDYISHHAAAAEREARSRLKESREAEAIFRQSIPTTLVMEELKNPRQTQILLRGQYDQPGDAVQPGVPSALPAWPNEAPRNRLGFAKWLVSDENPLTARVAVNRLWKQCFGEGFVRTMNDFGTQGELPTHPELLDWLAVHFRETGWDVKSMLRLIVTSRTYRQRSEFRLDGLNVADPQNRMLSRGPSFRMSAEMIRDQALAVSGLLHPQIGGPSVKPYQPDGLWEEVSYNAEDSYIPDIADGLWRRSIYTYIKRQAPPPAFLAFDGTTREKCSVQRARTNTPQQSLILLNDPTYVEAARVLATALLQRNESELSRLKDLFRSILSRTPDVPEMEILLALLNRQRSRFRDNREDALLLLNVGVRKTPDTIDPVEAAAWTIVAHTVLNLDEAITRR